MLFNFNEKINSIFYFSKVSKNSMIFSVKKQKMLIISKFSQDIAEIEAKTLIAKSTTVFYITGTVTSAAAPAFTDP